MEVLSSPLPTSPIRTVPRNWTKFGGGLRSTGKAEWAWPGGYLLVLLVTHTHTLTLLNRAFAMWHAQLPKFHCFYSFLHTIWFHSPLAFTTWERHSVPAISKLLDTLAVSASL